jgi:hypothetical protein
MVGYSAGGNGGNNSFNVYVGYFAGNNMNSTQNTAVGASAMAGASGATGTGNTAVGYQALDAVSTGEFNTAIGHGALGNNTTYSNSSGLGYNALVTGSNQCQIGDGNVDAYAKSFNPPSDSRDKADIQDTNLGLNFIMQLQPRMFRWDMREFYRPAKPGPEASQEEVNAWLEASKLANLTHDGTYKRNRLHQGLIAQEVKAVMDAMGTDFGGFRDASFNGGDAQMTLEYTQFIAPLIKAIQELKAEFDEYKRTHP